MIKIEFHKLEKWWNASSKIVELLLTWQGRVSKFGTPIESALKTERIFENDVRLSR